jgi:hypothetical protein
MALVPLLKVIVACTTIYSKIVTIYVSNVIRALHTTEMAYKYVMDVIL